jgi:dTDP-4-dehydrorhamnose reductase
VIDIDDCDVTDLPMLRARLVVEAPDIIINAAAYTAIDDAEGEEELARAINAIAVAAMVDAMSETGGKVVHVSTALVFDGLSARPYRPDDLPNPLSAYGRTKAEGESALRPTDLLVRTSWVYGADGDNIARAMLELMKKQDQIHVIVDQIGSPTWAVSLADVIWGLVRKGAEGIFHYSDAGLSSLHEFAVAIGEEAHALGLLARIPAIIPIETADDPAAARRPALCALDCSSTCALLEQDHVDWRTNLRQMLMEELRSD